MSTTSHHDERIAQMTFASVYPHYVTKVEKRGRSKEELHEVIKWLTGFNERSLQKQIKDETTFAARVLGISRATPYRRLAAFGIR